MKLLIMQGPAFPVLISLTPSYVRYFPQHLDLKTFQSVLFRRKGDSSFIAKQESKQHYIYIPVSASKLISRQADIPKLDSSLCCMLLNTLLCTDHTESTAVIIKEACWLIRR
jgi:hypothetical protein